MVKRGLLLLFGESFRLGGQGNRNTGTEESYDGQMKACHTHMKLITHLQEKGIDMDVSINSYTTRYDDDLNNVYGEVLIDCVFYKGLMGQTKLIHECIDRINTDTYDFILCMRIDLYLKDMFMGILNTESNRIQFPSVCFEPHHKVGIHPRVNDMMMYIPKRYISFMKEHKFNLSHNAWYDLVEGYKLTYTDLDMMLNTYNDSDSAKDYNPIYYIVNRPECNTHKTKKIFNKYRF